MSTDTDKTPDPIAAAVDNARHIANQEKNIASNNLKALKEKRTQIDEAIREATARLQYATRTLAALNPRPRTPRNGTKKETTK